MKRALLVLSLFGLIACGGNASKIANPPAPLPSCADAKAGETCIPSAPTVAIFHGEDWSITIPVDYEKNRLPFSPVGITGAVFVNKKNERLVVVMREADGALATMTEEIYAERLVQQMTADGAVVIGAIELSTINGRPFSVINIHKNDVQMYAYIQLQNSVAHVVMCGGRLHDTQVGTVCYDTVHTFHIN